MEKENLRNETDRWQKQQALMKTSILGISLIKHFEQCKLKAYQDSKGVWTIGWGNTFYEDGKSVKKGDKITQDRADELFYIILKQFEKDVNSLLTRIVPQHQFDPLMSFAYNVCTDIDIDTKAEGLGDSTLLKKVNADAPAEEVKAEFLKWNRSGGKVLNGLTKRRKAEAHLYATGELLLPV